MKNNVFILEFMKIDEEFKQYVEILIQQYINKAIYFINNVDKFKIIIPKEEILNDNQNMMMKSIIRLNKLINNSKIKIKSSMIF